MDECISSENIPDGSCSKLLSDMQSCQEVNTEKVMEPILLEDVDWNHEKLNSRDFLSASELSKSEFLVQCIYIFMLEYGFIPPEKEGLYNDSSFNFERIKELKNVQGWKKIDGTSYRLSLIIPLSPIYTCEILCVKIGEDLIVSSVVKNIEEARFSLMLDILSYFTDNIYANANVLKVQNLKQLSTLFKSQIAFPIKHLILRISGIRHACIEDMPSEIILLIFKYLHGTDIVRLAETSKLFYSLIENTKFWVNLICRDFEIDPMKFNDVGEISYKELMKRYGSFYRSDLARKKTKTKSHNNRTLFL